MMADDPISLRIFVDQDTKTAIGEVYFDDGKTTEYLTGTSATFVKLIFSEGKLAMTRTLQNFAGPKLDKIELVGIRGTLSNARLVSQGDLKALQIIEGSREGEWSIVNANVSMTEFDWQIVYDTATKW